MKRALIYNPYFDTLGGGEKYTAGVIQALIERGFEVVVAWGDASLSKKLQQRFGLDLEVRIDKHIYNTLTRGSIINKFLVESQFDLIFWVSDGSIPFMFGKQNILHFQVPFMGTKLSPVDRFKFKSIHAVVCNSLFTKNVIDKTYFVDSVVVYPPCMPMTPKLKDKTILSVGRFDGLLHSKRQDVLIDAFKILNAPGWKLVLAGGDMGQTNTLEKLKLLIGDLPIELFVNPDYETIEKLYGGATLFWHAAGFEVDETLHPDRVEHFGIATVEAMSAGAVPLVYKAGGQPEIVQNEKNGYLWSSESELIELTQQLVDNSDNLKKLSLNAKITSRQFDMEHFVHAFTDTCLS